jgi:hypothetical protein
MKILRIQSTGRRVRIIGLYILILLLPVATLYAEQPGCPAVGAIRWDAWYGKDGPVGVAVEKSLGPSKWHSRLPFCGRVLGQDQVEIECDSAAVMENEIRYAVQAGIDYWAFLVYDRDNPMSKSFNYYLSSPNKHLVKFSLIMQFLRWGDPQSYNQENKRAVDLMKEPSYQKVHANRPLFFVYKVEQDKLHKTWGGVQGFRPVIQHLRREAQAAGLGNPFIVVMEPNPERAKQLMDGLGLDAISTYSVHSGKAGASYAELAKFVHNYWDRSRKTGAQVVPIVMAGWDNRPRAANPAPWQAGREKLGTVYYGSPQPEEISALVGDAVRWAKLNAGTAAPNPVIIYAWNEHDEGGWLEPTLSDGARRVEAVGKTLRALCPSK